MNRRGFLRFLVAPAIGLGGVFAAQASPRVPSSYLAVNWGNLFDGATITMSDLDRGEYVVQATRYGANFNFGMIHLNPPDDVPVGGVYVVNPHPDPSAQPSGSDPLLGLRLELDRCRQAARLGVES